MGRRWERASTLRPLFPPDPDLDGGQARPHVRGAGPHVRGAGPRGRPAPLVGAVALLATWVALAGMIGRALAPDTHLIFGTGAGAVVRTNKFSSVAGAAFWIVALAVVLWRVWCGGRTAIAFVVRYGTRLGVLLLAGAIAFTVLILVAPLGVSGPSTLVHLLPMFCAGAALLAAGLLLRRPEVRRWSGS